MIKIVIWIKLINWCCIGVMILVINLINVLNVFIDILLRVVKKG